MAKLNHSDTYILKINKKQEGLIKQIDTKLGYEINIHERLK